MGAQLMAAAFARWTHLSDVAFRILLRMSLTALDEESNGRPACLYFGGREVLAASLRRPFPVGDSEAAKKKRKNIYGDVRHAIKELVKEGAIEIVATGQAVRVGHAQTYRLCLMPGGVHNPASGGVHNPASGGVIRPPEGGSTTPPRNHEEPGDERWEEEGADLSTQVQYARAPASSNEDRILCQVCKRELELDGYCFNCQMINPAPKVRR